MGLLALMMAILKKHAPEHPVVCVTPLPGRVFPCSIQRCAVESSSDPSKSRSGDSQWKV
ncbi:hypothetical protein KIN20_026068 [Parelaphostrongylus tenuis]|uniref:Uncharacterized protein n=1 Tax=Parelaphostrongylus tenuis TaxID=148309 RepID=A0AAD5QXV4_PARTN|nr:hypothetical protein KIN20_026068 [Parelaphostrongylus tenuis]